MVPDRRRSHGATGSRRRCSTRGASSSCRRRPRASCRARSSTPARRRRCPPRPRHGGGAVPGPDRSGAARRCPAADRWRCRCRRIEGGARRARARGDGLADGSAGLSRVWCDRHGACGFDGLAAQVQTVLAHDPHDGALFVFRGKRGDLMKAIWWDGQGMCLFAKRLERGRFVWPVTKDGSVKLSAAQLSMLLEGSTGARRCASGSRRRRREAQRQSASGAGSSWDQGGRFARIRPCPAPRITPAKTPCSGPSSRAATPS